MLTKSLRRHRHRRRFWERPTLKNFNRRRLWILNHGERGNRSNQNTTRPRKQRHMQDWCNCYIFTGLNWHLSEWKLTNRSICSLWRRQGRQNQSWGVWVLYEWILQRTKRFVWQISGEDDGGWMQKTYWYWSTVWN